MNLFKKNNLLNYFIFLFFTGLVFLVFKDLFNSYFEADEWFHFTNYLPVTKEPYGFLTTLLKTITDTDLLSRGQHLVPIGEEIFFLNTLFFGTNYTPYIFISLLLHSINSFLVFLFIKELFRPGVLDRKKELIALTGGIFFAVSQIHFHAFAWAAFYGQNNLSVTFFILCLLFLKKAFNTNKKSFLYLALLFLFLDLFTKETSTALFLVLPFIVFLEKKIKPINRNIFKVSYLIKLYILSIIIFTVFRFIIPNLYLGLGNLANKWVDNYISSANKSVENKDDGTILSTDLSIHENIYAELLFRAVTFPVKMTSEFYFPRETILKLVSVVTPVIYPQPGGGDEQIRSQYRQFFLNGPGNDMVVYLISIFIILFLLFKANLFYKNKKYIESKIIITGLGIIFFGAIPLVFIVLSFPRWGYDTYLDSRHYYMPSVGAAIIFPFLLIGIGEFISKTIFRLFRFHLPILLISFLVFLIWFSNNLMSLNRTFNIMVQISGIPRREVVNQLKKNVPVLPQKAVFFVQTDGLGAYGSLLPFQTSFPPILTVIYYDKNPLPDSFFNKFFLEGKTEGYLYSEGRGLGFFNTKKTLLEELLKNNFLVNDIFAFYYDSQKIKLKNITPEVRKEMNVSLLEAKKNLNWKIYNDSELKIMFKYPPEVLLTEVLEKDENPKILKKLILGNPEFSAQVKVFSISPVFDIIEFGNLQNDGSGLAMQKKLYFDKFQFNEAVIITEADERKYLIKFTDKLIYVNIQNYSKESIDLIEKILGSVKLVDI